MADLTADTTDSVPTLPPGLRPATVAVTAGRPAHSPDQPLNVPVTLAATYVAGGDLEYGRYANPTWTAFEDALGALEGGRCLSFSSGLAAIATILDLVGAGATVVAPRHGYTGSIMQLADLEARGRLKAVLVDVTDTAALVAACEDAAIVWLETPTNPALEVIDLPPVIEAAHAAGAYVVVDNTFATPLLQQPLSLGADLVVHSATKFIAGHSDVLMGAVITGSDELYDVLKGRRDLVGNVPGPFESWLALRGLRTLPVRLDRAQANAKELVSRLADHPAVVRGALPRVRRDRVDRGRPGRPGRRPGHPLDQPVGARHQPGRGGVDLRAPSPLEGRGGDDPGRPGPARGGHRGRRGPVVRPRRGAGRRAPGGAARRLTGPRLRAAGRIGTMSIIKINAITVAADSGDELAQRFAARAGAVDGEDGFEGFELLKPTDERTTWLVVTRWRDEAAFEAWVSGPAFGRGHQGPPAGSPPAGHGHGAGQGDGQGDGQGEKPAGGPVGMSSELWSYVVAGGSAG